MTLKVFVEKVWWSKFNPQNTCIGKWEEKTIFTKLSSNFHKHAVIHRPLSTYVHTFK